ncbi:TetR/AcrR family transcriptional regulator, partial [Streptomyces sp. SID5473]|nr:TetR/AcrR family transcriptional regulator [Streptomyces sp. SID5473]
RFLINGLDGLCMSLVIEGAKPDAGTRRALDQLLAAAVALASGPDAP